jgi:hypothetical protein
MKTRESMKRGGAEAGVTENTPENVKKFLYGVFIAQKAENSEKEKKNPYGKIRGKRGRFVARSRIIVLTEQRYSGIGRM